jgi:hypothetical protein
VSMDHNFGQFYNYLAYLSTIKYGTEKDIKLLPNQFSFLYKKAKSSQLKCVVFWPTQFCFCFQQKEDSLCFHLNFPKNQYSFREITTKCDQFRARIIYSVLLVDLDGVFEEQYCKFIDKAWLSNGYY